MSAMFGFLHERPIAVYATVILLQRVAPFNMFSFLQLTD